MEQFSVERDSESLPAISSLLLPREKYAEASKEYGPGPIMFEIENNKQSMFYFGANHSRNPADSQYPALKSYWKKFLQATTGKDRIVLVEGGLRSLEKDEKTAIERSSEGGLITLLAHNANVQTACPDIRSEELLKQLPDISKEEDLLYDFLIWFNNFRTLTEPKPDFHKNVEKWLEWKKQQNQTWADINISFEYIKNLYKNILGQEFNEKINSNNLVDPNKTETRMNQIARAQSDLRDANIASEIVRYWKEGKSIFVVFGSGHLIIEKPALQKLLS